MKDLISFVENRFQWELDNFQNLQINQQVTLLSIHEKVLLYKYTDDAYQLLNENLRDNTNNTHYLEFEQHLNTVLSKLPNYEGLVYRGADLDIAEIQKYRDAEASGDTIEEPAFASSSKSRTTAMGFTNVDTLFRIHSRTGKDVEQFSRSPYEGEVLFASKTKFRVLSVTNEHNLTLITMEEL